MHNNTYIELEMMVSQVIMPKVYCLESVVCGHHIYKRVWTPVVEKKVLVDIKEDNAGQQSKNSCNSKVWHRAFQLLGASVASQTHFHKKGNRLVNCIMKSCPTRMKLAG